ncbi:MAG: signal recognition particle [Acidithiobacillales bacterium SM1_46]|nr:MAG: signal recognition particle [Acidithiobacillales bacterium SM1_46]
MFDNLTNRLQGTLKRLRGEGRLTEENMRETLREVRMALLEADVALPVVKDFIEQVRLRAQGQEVLSSLTPGQALIKVVQEELVGLMGTPEPLQVAPPPAVILVAGLQGAGKTTTVGKLARFIVDRHKKSVLVASTDVYRPAAIEQLKRLATQVGVEFFPSDPQDKPVEIAAGAVNEARRRVIDVVLVDSAGRLHIDGEMMDEIRAVHEAIHPVETLFVVDSMTGQDAVNTAKAFNEALPLSGVILTKTDGDARGGAALSLRKVTGKPIKFLGVGEGMQALEAFDAQRVASRILGMGDVVALVEQAYQAADQEKSQALAKKIAKGKGFDLDDFREQLRQMEKMGGLASVVDKLPGMGEVPEHVRAQMNDKQTARLIAIINSMTPGERRNPDMIRGSRKRRIASGSGTQVQEVNRLLKQYEDMQRMMKSFGKGGLGRMLQGMKGKLPGIPR